MLRAWTLGHVFGIRVQLHWTVFLVPAVMVLWTMSAGWPTALLSAALVAAIFLCVLLHEFGHALTARAYGIPTRDITLLPIGGVARLEGLSRRPSEEIFIALAGPAVNVAISLLLVLALLTLGVTRLGVVVQEVGRPGLGSFLFHLLLSNLLLAFFNLLPAFPMDGGRVLRSLLALALSRVRATEIAVAVGMTVAVVIVVLPICGAVLLGMPYNPMLMVIGGFVFVAGKRELGQVRQLEAERLEAEERGPEVVVEIPE